MAPLQAPATPVSNGGTQIHTTSNFRNNFTKFNSKGKGKKDKDKKKIGLRKEDISEPKDFRHVQHVGWDPSKGYDLDVSPINIFFYSRFLHCNNLY